MNTSGNYIVRCSCGREINIRSSEAGATIHCSCGDAVEIPSLGTLRRTQRQGDAESRRTSGDIQSLAGACSEASSQPPSEQKQVDATEMSSSRGRLISTDAPPDPPNHTTSDEERPVGRMSQPKTRCSKCGCEILQSTADDNGGLCTACYRGRGQPTGFDFFQRRGSKQLVDDLRRTAAKASAEASDTTKSPRDRLLARQQAEFAEWSANLVHSPFTSGPLGCVTCLICVPAVIIVIGIVVAVLGPILPENMRAFGILAFAGPMIPLVVMLVARITYSVPRLLFSTVGYAVPVKSQRTYGKIRLSAPILGVLVSAMLAQGISMTLIVYGYRFSPDMPLGLYLWGVTLGSVFNVFGGYAAGHLGRGREVLHSLAAGALSSLITPLLVLIVNSLQDEFRASVGIVDMIVPALVAMGFFALGGYYALCVREAAWQKRTPFIRFHGALLIALGLLIISWASIVLLNPNRHGAEAFLFVLILGFGGRTLVLGRCWLHSSRCFSQNADAEVLLLRSFGDDMLLMPFSGRERVIPWVSIPALFKVYRPTFEECVVTNAAQLGRVAAIADPEEDAFALGAIRLRASSEDDAWKRVVQRHIDAARAIIVLCRDSHGLEWELSELVHRRSIGKTIFVLPPTYIDEKQVRWAATAKTLADAGCQSSSPKISAETLCIVWDEETGWRTVSGYGGCSRRDYKFAFSRATRLLSLEEQ